MGQRDRKSKERSRKLFALLVVTGASLAAPLASTACSDNNPPPADAGSDGAGQKFW